MTKLLELNSIILALFGVSIFGLLAKFFAYLKNRRDKIEIRLHTLEQSNETRFKNLEEANLAMLHDSLYEKCSHFIEQGYITVDDLDNLDYLFRGYVGLGGNGTGEHLYKQVKKLKLKK